MTNMIEASGLVKHYKEVKALDGLDLSVPEGDRLGLLGPNGAGKTTAVRILTTLLEADAGQAMVAGIDVATHPNEVRRLIGLSGQYAAVDEYLTGFENLDMFGRLYRLGKGQAARASPGAAGALRPGGSRRPSGQDLLRRNATPARPGRGLVAEPRSCSSTSPPPVSTRGAGPTCGSRSGRW